MSAHPSPYSEIITAATAARGDDAVMIEEIMRTEIFHSTLDWQSRAQLEEAARAALKILRANRRFYTFALMERRLALQEMTLEQQLAKHSPSSPRLGKIRQNRSERVAARGLLDRLTNSLCHAI